MTAGSQSFLVCLTFPLHSLAGRMETPVVEMPLGACQAPSASGPVVSIPRSPLTKLRGRVLLGG